MARRILLVIGGLLLLPWLITSSTDTPQDSQPVSVNTQHNLLVQRRDILEEHLELEKRRYTAGVSTEEDVAFANDFFLKAELELASSQKERIEICEKRFDNARRLERNLVILNDVGHAPRSRVLLATATRLQTEIDCVRE